MKSEEIIYNIVIDKIDKSGHSIEHDSQKSHKSLKTGLLEHIHKHYHDNNLCLCSMADAFGKSESYISHFFKKFCDDNFYHYLENIRMEEAKRLLVETSLSIKEITIRTGYSSMHSFRRAFKKIFDVSPSSFRRI